MSAQLIKRAFWNSASSPNSGWAAASMAAMALCSSENSVCIMPRPSQKPGTRVGSFAGSGGIGGSPSTRRSRPPAPSRTNRCWARLLP